MNYKILVTTRYTSAGVPFLLVNELAFSSQTSADKAFDKLLLQENHPFQLDTVRPRRHLEKLY